MASSSAIAPKEKYDAIISFRGVDTRKTFTSHLYSALVRNKIYSYIDYNLQRGEELEPALLEAIEQSKIHVVIFSDKYASSTWCLKELAYIMDCEGRGGRYVIPVFYGIDPSDVRNQTGSYATAFAEHEKRLGLTDEVLKWKGALTKAANRAGYNPTSKTVRDDNDLVEQIVTDVLTKLKHDCTSTVPDNLVGVEARIQSIVRELDILPNDSRVCFLVIWGMGGIGKTTLADVVFHRISSQFEACCFLANVREESGSKGNHSPQLYDLRNKLLGKLLNDKDIKITALTPEHDVKKRLNRTKVLVVLDDVDHSSQLEFLAGGEVPFGPGSRIIITTRDFQPVQEMQGPREVVGREVKTYQVKELDVAESKQFFLSSTPTDLTPNSKILDGVLRFAAGVPLAIKVLSGQFLRCKSEKEQEQLWKKLREFPSKELQNVYRASFDGLEQNEREIFLDIACLHKGVEIRDVKSILDTRGLYPDDGIGILINRSLISVKPIEHAYYRWSNGGRDRGRDGYVDCIWMHDVIQEMGVDIVKEECAEEPGNRSRLHKYKDIFHVLKNNTGTSKVHSIHLNFGETVPDSDKPDAGDKETPIDFRLMCNLFFCAVGDQIIMKPAEPVALPSSLKYLLWDAYVPKSLHFSPENLVELHMPHSHLHTLWNKDQNPVNLKIIDLSYSYELVEVAFLSNCVNIERINLRSCVRVQVPDLTKCVNIKSINLRNCTGMGRMAQVPDMSNSVNIERIDLREWKLETVPLYFENFAKLTYLKLGDSIPPDNPSYSSTLFTMTKPDHLRGCFGITSISSECVTERSRLSSVDLQHCCFFRSLPTNIWNLKHLKSLNLSGCIRFRVFPRIWEPMKSLEDLNLCGTGIEELPSTFARLVGLQRLNLSFCSRLRLFPDCIKQILTLKKLILIDCKQLQSLPELPCRLQFLDASGCTSLTTVSVSVTDLTAGVDQIKEPMKWSERHSFTGCLNLDTSARSNIMDDAHQRITRMAIAWNEWGTDRTVGNIYDGLALSTIVSLGDASAYNHGGLITCQMILKIKYGEDHRVNLSSGSFDKLVRGRDNVLVWYTNLSTSQVSAFINETKRSTKASFHFRVTNYLDEPLPNIFVRKCGVSFLPMIDQQGEALDW